MLIPSGSFATTSYPEPTPSSTAYRVIGGIGTRQFGLFRASAYFGYQGSDTSGSPSAGGNVFGGALTYYPTRLWTISANIDETINIASALASPSTQALTIPVDNSTANFGQQFHANDRDLIAFHLRNLPAMDRERTLRLHAGSISRHNAVEQRLDREMRSFDMICDGTSRSTWEYQYSSIVSNVPLSTAIRNFITMSASYRF